MKAIVVKLCVVLTGIVAIFTFFSLKDRDNNEFEFDPTAFTNQPIQLNRYVTPLSTSVKQYEVNLPDTFELVSENDYLSLHLERKTLAIAIVDKTNHYTWYSYDVNADLNHYSDSVKRSVMSGVTIETYNQFTQGSRSVMDPGTKITYKLNQNGFIATVDFYSIKIKFDVSVKIEGDDLLIEVPRDSVSEYNPELWKAGNKDVSLNNIILYPFLGSTEQEENGYIVIPDGSGALVSLEDEPKYKLSFSAPVYGKDLGYEDPAQPTMYNIQTIKPLSRITLPIHGIIHDENNAGLLVISESGANYATYNYVSKDVTTDYYQSYFKYNYRTTYKQFQSRTDTGKHILGFQKTPNEFDIKQRYVFLSKDDADYVGVAKNYRSYLEDQAGFLTNENNQSQYSTKIDIIGNEIENGLFRPRYVEATSYDETVALIKTLQSDGYQNLDVSYKTYNKNDFAYRFDIYRNLGGKNEFKEMITFFNNEPNIEFNYFTDYINTYQKTRQTARKLNKTEMSILNYSHMYQKAYLNSPEYIAEMVDEDIQAYKDANIQSISINGLDKALFTHNEDNQLISSTANMGQVNEAMQSLLDEGIKTSFYNPDAYLYRYTTRYYDAPITSSEQMFIDATIPLVQLVTSGNMDLFAPYLNFISNEQNTLLRLVEYGLNPSYIMTAKNAYELKQSNASGVFVSQYDSLKNRMKRYDEFLEEGLNVASHQELVDHQFLSEGVTLSRYKDGSIILVNYTDQDYEYQGTIIKSKGYDVL